jgi:hypothetical protein
MSKTILNGGFKSAGGTGGGLSNPLHSAAGRLIAFLVSHAQSTVQTVTFYDSLTSSGTVILTINVDPAQCPYYVRFDRNAAIPFSTGLSIAQGQCDIAVWSIDNG